MKFCDEKIQECLLNGGKIKRTNQKFSYYLSESLKRFCYKYNNEIREYSISKEDLEADDWTIVEPEYDWDKIIKDKILCIFSHQEDFEYKAIATLNRINNRDDTYFTSQGVWFRYCKPFNPAEYNIAKDLKEYEK